MCAMNCIRVGIEYIVVMIHILSQNTHITFMHTHHNRLYLCYIYTESEWNLCRFTAHVSSKCVPYRVYRIAKRKNKIFFQILNHQNEQTAMFSCSSKNIYDNHVMIKTWMLHIWNLFKRNLPIFINSISFFYDF